MRRRAKTPPADEPQRVTFVPDIDFVGYPEGDKVTFTADVRSLPVPADYSDLMRQKGLVRADTPILPADEDQNDHQA